MEFKNIPIGEVLKEYGYVTESQIQQALSYQKEHKGKRLGGILIELGYITEHQMLEALAQRLNLPIVEWGTFTVDVNAAGKVPVALAKKYHVLPISLKDDILNILTNDPLNFYGLEDIRQLTGCQLQISLSEVSPLDKAIDFYYSEVAAQKAAKAANDSKEETVQEVVLEEGEGDAPVIKLLSSLVQRAYSNNASDIHVEPFEHRTIVRMRIDGTMTEFVTLQRSVHASLIARIKILGDMDIAERRVPQDGHFRIQIDGEYINIRVSVIPTVYGEKAVLRLLASNTVIDYVDSYGMNETDYARFAPMLNAPNGIVYLTGPTGSGKSTTLYMVLEQLSKRSVNISTIEDPVEKNVYGINQMQVNNQAGITFEVGLRALLRQDPDIIMVGETRDSETASISIRAAITGHLVFSTLHTNDAVSSIVRLKDMGMEPYMIANSLVGIVAQRLMKKVCPHCAADRETTEQEREYLGRDVWTVKEARGCSHCNQTGYQNRIAIHEIVSIDRNIREMISTGATMEEITRYAVEEQGMVPLRVSGVDLVRRGITTMEELMKIAYYA